MEHMRGKGGFKMTKFDDKKQEMLAHFTEMKSKKQNNIKYVVFVPDFYIQ